jgi:hypothetical protein
MSNKTPTIETFTQSNLWHEFEKTAREKRRRPVELLADVIADFLETQEGVSIFDDLENDLSNSDYTENDAVEIVKTYRQSRRK